MAQFNEIDEGGLNQLLVRRLGMKTGSPAPTIAPELMPNITLENDRPEWGYLKGEMWCAGNFTVPLVAGQFGYVQFNNPVSSRSICTIRHIENVFPGDVFVSRAAYSTLAVGTTEYAGVCDLRFRFRTMQLQTQRFNVAAVPADQGRFALLNGVNVKYDAPIVLTPGSLCRVEATTAAQDISFNVIWYERPASDGELV